MTVAFLVHAVQSKKKKQLPNRSIFSLYISNSKNYPDLPITPRLLTRCCNVIKLPACVTSGDSSGEYFPHGRGRAFKSPQLHHSYRQINGPPNGGPFFLKACGERIRRRRRLFKKCWQAIGKRRQAMGKQSVKTGGNYIRRGVNW